MPGPCAVSVLLKEGRDPPVCGGPAGSGVPRIAARFAACGGLILGTILPGRGPSVADPRDAEKRRDRGLAGLLARPWRPVYFLGVGACSLARLRRRWVPASVSARSRSCTAGSP